MSIAHEVYPWTACDASEGHTCSECGGLIRGVVFCREEGLLCQECADKQAFVGAVLVGRGRRQIA